VPMILRFTMFTISLVTFLSLLYYGWFVVGIGRALPGPMSALGGLAFLIMVGSLILPTGDTERSSTTYRQTITGWVFEEDE